LRRARKPSEEGQSARQLGARMSLPPRKAEVELVKLKLAVVLLAAFLASSSCARSTGVTPAPGFPIRIATAAGTVTISRQPTRIISLSATATEDLYAVGAGNQVVAVDPYSTYPPNAPRTKLSGFNPNAE